MIWIFDFVKIAVLDSVIKAWIQRFNEMKHAINRLNCIVMHGKTMKSYIDWN